MSKILLHTCCGPCTTYVNKWLSENDFEATGFFYNPNIFPQDEYLKRKENMQIYAQRLGLDVIYAPNDQRTLPGECVDCYRIRLSKTAEQAKQLGYDCFSTTLLISPYQKINLIKEVGEEVSLRYNIAFFYQDFRAGYSESRKMSRGMNLYMQKYCGCAVETIAKPEVVYAQAS